MHDPSDLLHAESVATAQYILQSKVRRL